MTITPAEINHVDALFNSAFFLQPYTIAVIPMKANQSEPSAVVAKRYGNPGVKEVMRIKGTVTMNTIRIDMIGVWNLSLTPASLRGRIPIISRQLQGEVQGCEIYGR